MAAEVETIRERFGLGHIDAAMMALNNAADTEMLGDEQEAIGAAEHAALDLEYASGEFARVLRRARGKHLREQFTKANELDAEGT